MKIRKFSIKDYEEVVNMHYEFCKEVYPNRAIGAKYAFYLLIDKWITSNCDIVVAYNKDEICGFSMCFVNNMDGLTEPVYQAEIAYIKPQHRKGRAAYLLYNNAYQYAKEQELKIVTLSRTINKVDEMVNKHFNLNKTYIMYEG